MVTCAPKSQATPWLCATSESQLISARLGLEITPIPTRTTARRTPNLKGKSGGTTGNSVSSPLSPPRFRRGIFVFPKNGPIKKARLKPKGVRINQPRWVSKKNLTSLCLNLWYLEPRRISTTWLCLKIKEPGLRRF